MNRRIGLNTLGIFLALVWIFPVYWMLNTAFLPLDKVRSATPTFMPFGGELSAFKRVFTPNFAVQNAAGLELTELGSGPIARVRCRSLAVHGVDAARVCGWNPARARAGRHDRWLLTDRRVL